MLLVLLLAYTLLAFVPGVGSVPPIDRDEPRYTQASKQMLESGDYVDIRFQDEPRYKKPIGIYWLQALAVGVTGDPGSIRSYRIPSFVGAWLAVLLTFELGRRMFDPATGFLAASLLATSVLVAVEATLATTDAALLASITAAALGLWSIYAAVGAARTPPFLEVTGFWIALGAGILLKGPVAPAVVLLTVAALAFRSGIAPAQWLRAFRPAWGLVVLALVVAPWGVAIALESGGAFYLEAFRGDLLPKLLGGQESHGGPPGTYLALAPVTLFPATLVLLPALATVWRSRERRAERFCLAWIAPTWALFECLPTKLPHYVLPVFPPLVLLAARYALASPEAGPLARISHRIWIAIALAVAASGVAASLLLRVTPGVSAWILAAAAGAAVVIVTRELRAGRLPRAAAWAIAASAVTVPVLLGGVLPGLEPLWLTERAAGVAAASPGPFAAVGYHEPSLVLRLGTDTRLIGPDEGARFLARHEDALLLVADRERAAVEEAARATGISLRERAAFEGFHYTKGRWIRLAVVERKAR